MILRNMLLCCHDNHTLMIMLSNKVSTVVKALKKETMSGMNSQEFIMHHTVECHTNKMEEIQNCFTLFITFITLIHVTTKFCSQYMNSFFKNR